MTANDRILGCIPCLILAHADAGYASAVGRSFRRAGWDVYRAGTGPEARRLTRMLQPQLVVLQADLPGESGWLTCEKLKGEFPHVRVILVAADPTALHETFAEFVGAAALLNSADGPAALHQEVAAAPVPAGS